MQLKIIQIALGWRGEKYSLKVSDWMRSKLCDTVRHMHEAQTRPGSVFYFLFGFRGLGSSRTSCRGCLDWRGIPVFPPFLFFVFLVTGMQLVSMSPHNVNSALQVGREKPHTHTHTGCGQMLHLRHVCWRLSGRPSLHLRSKSCERSGPHVCIHAGRTRQFCRHGNLSSVEERKSSVMSVHLE